MSEENTKDKTMPLVSILLESKEEGKYYAPYTLIEPAFFKLPTTAQQMAGYFISFFKPFLETLPEDKREQYQKDTIEWINKFMTMNVISKQN